MTERGTLARRQELQVAITRLQLRLEQVTKDTDAALIRSDLKALFDEYGEFYDDIPLNEPNLKQS